MLVNQRRSQRTNLIRKQTSQRLLEFQLLKCQKKTRLEEARVVELEYLLLVIPGLDKILPLVPLVLLIQELRTYARTAFNRRRGALPCAPTICGVCA